MVPFLQSVPPFSVAWSWDVEARTLALVFLAIDGVVANLTFQGRPMRVQLRPAA